MHAPEGRVPGTRRFEGPARGVDLAAGIVSPHASLDGAEPARTTTLASQVGVSLSSSWAVGFGLRGFRRTPGHAARSGVRHATTAGPALVEPWRGRVGGPTGRTGRLRAARSPRRACRRRASRPPGCAGGARHPARHTGFARRVAPPQGGGSPTVTTDRRDHSQHGPSRSSGRSRGTRRRMRARSKCSGGVNHGRGIRR
jgi:hypothetical protein